MEKREITCIGCPMGCALTVVIDGEEISVTGNTCAHGADYAKKEVTAPTRVVTSTVRIEGADIARVSVKTAGDVPKSKIFDCMEQIRALSVKAPVAIGDVILADCAGTGVGVIITKNVPAKG